MAFLLGYIFGMISAVLILKYYLKKLDKDFKNAVK